MKVLTINVEERLLIKDYLMKHVILQKSKMRWISTWTCFNGLQFFKKECHITIHTGTKINSNLDSENQQLEEDFKNPSLENWNRI